MNNLAWSSSTATTAKPLNKPACRARPWLGAIALLLLVSLAAEPYALAADPAASSALVTANQAYAEARFPDAIQQYEQIVAHRGFSAPVLFDLGNAWLREGHPGRAILSYERALWLAPRSTAIAANLFAAQQHADLSPAPAGGRAPLLYDLRFDTYAWIGLAAVLGLCVGAVLWSRAGSARRGARLTIAACSLAVCFAVAGTAIRWSDLDRAVILDGLAPAHIAPAAAAAVSFDLREGELVHLERTFDSFRLVRTDDGRTGWVSARQVGLVLVSSSG